MAVGGWEDWDKDRKLVGRKATASARLLNGGTTWPAPLIILILMLILIRMIHRQTEESKKVQSKRAPPQDNSVLL